MGVEGCFVHVSGVGVALTQRSADTSLGLLGRVQAGDSEAWQEFTNRCYDVIRQWCRWHQVSGPDTDDVLQNSMLVVLQKIGAFRHTGRGSMRGWLKAIAWRCWCDAMARANRGALESLRKQYAVAVDEIAVLEQQYELLRQETLLQQAMLLVKQRVRPSTWSVFYRTAWLNEPCSVVAGDLQIPAYVIHSARNRVQRMIQQEVRRLEGREMLMEAESQSRSIVPEGWGACGSAETSPS